MMSFYGISIMLTVLAGSIYTASALSSLSVLQSNLIYYGQASASIKSGMYVGLVQTAPSCYPFAVQAALLDGVNMRQSGDYYVLSDGYGTYLSIKN